MALPEPDLSPVAVAVALLTVALGPEFAAIVGAYSVILIGWVGGVMVGVWRMPPAPRPHLAAFVLVSLVASLGVTVPLAELLADFMRAAAPWASRAEAKGLLLPLAFAIPAIGHSWADVAAWAWGVLRRRVAPKGDRG